MKQSARTGIPLNPRLLIALLVAIKAQHTKMGKNSPLSMLDWEKNGPLIDEAAEADARLASIEKESEKLSERRSVLVTDSLADFARSSRDVLTGTFRGALHQMVDFGFNVDDTPRVKKKDGSEKKAA